MAAPRSYEKYLQDDELKAKSEEIDLFHLDFDWKEFRKHDMRFPFGLKSYKPKPKHNNNNNKNNNTQESNGHRNGKYSNDKMFQNICENWSKLDHEMKINDNNNNNNN
eukprot:160069_1